MIKKDLGARSLYLLFHPSWIAFRLHHRQLSFHALHTERSLKNVKDKLETDFRDECRVGTYISSATIKGQIKCDPNRKS